MPAQPPSLSLLLDNDVANFNVIYDDYFDVFFCYCLLYCRSCCYCCGSFVDVYWVNLLN